MPFIGKDWRSPGEAWVKTETLGWQRMKIIESQLHPGCHQSSACSWPPRSAFGQHMSNNCKTDDEIHSESNSSDSSRCVSQSSSPSNSPEKTLHQSHHQHHHLHPITISSPYGKYSCCAHHSDSTRSSPNYYCSNVDHSHLPRAQFMSRSISKESVVTSNTDEGGNSQPSMRYNNSVSDFRISSSTASQFYDNIDNNNYTGHRWDKMEGGNCNNIQKNSTLSPILMKNGLKIDDKEIPGSLARSLDSINTQDSKIGHEPSTINNNNNCCCHNYSRQGSPNDVSKESNMKKAPHCRVSVRTKEVVMYNTISEACYSLDFCNAIHDIRRFNYICKLLHLLITQNLTSLSGCATKVLFTMLEQVAWEVSNNKRNIHILKNLLNELKIMIQKNYCWGRPIGSSLLWQQHFDTIERISQIVNGIELSPPKNETEQQTTFNDLPVEMVREILLRLNDYRDLINSAQASPVMRTMIDNQHIWHKLCKYHFTEQQLKLAIEHNNLFTKRGNGVCGLKYARTVSADGKTSFRNPVMHKLKYNSTRQQLEQTKNRRGGRHKEPTTDNPKSSYVTRAIKIFDNQGSSATLGSSRKMEKAGQDTAKNVKQSVNYSKRLNDVQRLVNKENVPTNINHSSQEVDWERIFHQLRKKFDLKEEYADCLLLCRHCRCLFWKSFGHPCIKNDELTNLENQQTGRLYPLVSRVQQNELQQSRPSVAILSRNFDNRAQGLSQNVVSESSPPPANVADRLQVGSQQPLNEPGNQMEERNQTQSRNRNNNSSSNEQSKQKVLVPKHVAISPQAFLKFFSL